MRQGFSIRAANSLSMKYIPAVLLLVALIISSAGCISLGTQTTDINMGNETVGHVYLTPITNNLLSNASVTEKFDMKVELFGLTFTKEGLTSGEAEGLMDTFSSLNTTNTSSLLDMGFLPSLDSIHPEDPGVFLNKIITMPMTSRDSEPFLNSLDFNGVGARIQASADRISELLGLV